MQLPSKLLHFCLWCYFLQTCQSRNHGTITSYTKSYTKIVSFFLWKSSWVISFIFQYHCRHPGPWSSLTLCLDYSKSLLLFSDSVSSLFLGLVRIVRVHFTGLFSGSQIPYLSTTHGGWLLNTPFHIITKSFQRSTDGKTDLSELLSRRIFSITGKITFITLWGGGKMPKGLTYILGDSH